ncbi:MAG: PGF-CTERM sorting domain-containing protein [Haloplanus sp.]
MTTRRNFLIGAAAASTGLVGAVGSASAQSQTFELEMTSNGWVGRSPSSIAGKNNPTLEVEAGKQYAIKWTNSTQGEFAGRHNLVVANSDGSVVTRSNYLLQQGATQTVRFKATGDLAEYYCEDHRNERGQFDVSGGSTPTATPTATPTPTSGGGNNGGGGGMDTDTPTSTPTATPTSGGGPGFGVGAAVTALGAAAYGTLRRNDDD